MGKKKKTQRQKRNKNKVTNMSKNFKTTTKTTWKMPVKPPCHTGQNKIFTTTSGIDVYGGGRNRQGGWWKMDPLPDLAIGPSETMTSFTASSATDVPDGWSCDAYTNKVVPPLTIDMDFPDFGVPQVQDLFWYALCDDIHEHGIKTVSTQCAGGHGRTGVQLCILYYLLNDDDVRATIQSAAQLIELIRDLHCEHAVETDEQQEYIARILDIPAGDSVISDRYGGWSGKAEATTTVATGSKYGPLDLEYEPWEENLDLDWDELTHDYDEAPASDVEPCPSCGSHKHYSNGACDKCHYVKPHKDEEKIMCFTCGVKKGRLDFMHTGEPCITCLAAQKKIKHTANEVQCHECKKMKTGDMLASFKNDKFLCLACDTKLNDPKYM